MHKGVRRVLLVAAGFVSLAIAAIGVVIPLLPTTPFVILAAACFSRSSPRMHQLLLDNRLFGPLIEAWSEHRCIPLRAKILAISMIAFFGTFAIIVIGHTWVRVALATLFVTVAGWLATRPSDPAAALAERQTN